MFIFSRRAPRARLDTLAGQIRTAGRSLETTALGGKALADSELQKRGATFLPKFLNDLFLGVSRKNFSIFPKNFHLSPKISDDLFLVIDLLFNVFNVVFSVGGQIRSRHRYGGTNILTFRDIHNAIITI